MKAFSVCLLWAIALLLSSHAAPQQDRRILRVSTSFGGRGSSDLTPSSPDASREPKLITEPRPGQEFVLLSSNPRPANTQRVQPTSRPASPSSVVRVARVQEIPGAILEDGILVAPNQGSDFSLESFGNFGVRSGRVVGEEPQNPVPVESRTNIDSGEPWRPLTLTDIVTGSIHRSDDASTVNETLVEKTTQNESVQARSGKQAEPEPVQIEQFSLADVVPVSSPTDQAQPVQDESEESKEVTATDTPLEESSNEKKSKSLKFEEKDAIPEEQVNLIAAETAMSSRTVVKKGENGQDYEYEYIYYYEDDSENDASSHSVSEPSLVPETRTETTTTPIPVIAEEVKTGTADETQSDIHPVKEDQPAEDLNQEQVLLEDVAQISTDSPVLQLVPEITESDDTNLSNDVQESLLVIPLADLTEVLTQTDSVLNAAPEVVSDATEAVIVEDDAITTFAPVTEPSSTTTSPTTTTTTTTAAPTTEFTTTSAPTRRGRPTSSGLRPRTRTTTVKTENVEEQPKPTRAPLTRGRNRFSTPLRVAPTTESPNANSVINVVNRFRSPIRRTTTTTTTTERTAQENLKPIGQRRLTRPTLPLQKRTGVAFATEGEEATVGQAPQTVVQIDAVSFDLPSTTEETVADFQESQSNFELELRASGEEDTEDRLPQVTRFPPRNRPSFPIENDETVTERSGPKFIDSSSFRQRPTTDSVTNQLGRLTVLSGPGIPVGVTAETVTEQIQQSDDEQVVNEPSLQRTSPLDEFFAVPKESHATQTQEEGEEETPTIDEVQLDHQEVPVTTEAAPVSHEDKILQDIVHIVTSALGEEEAKDAADIEIAEVGGEPVAAVAEVENQPQTETLNEEKEEQVAVVAPEPEVASVSHDELAPVIPLASEEPKQIDSEDSLLQVTSVASDHAKQPETEVEVTTTVSTGADGKVGDLAAPSHELVPTAVDTAEKEETLVDVPAIMVERDEIQVDTPVPIHQAAELESSTDPVLPKEENDVLATTEAATTTTTTTTELPTTTTTTTATPSKTTASNRFRGGASSRFSSSSSAFANKIRNRTREPASNSVIDSTTTATPKRSPLRRTSSTPLFRKPVNAEEQVTGDSTTADNADSSSTPARGNVRNRPQIANIRGRFNLRRGSQNNETNDDSTNVEPTTAAPRRVTTTRRPLVAPVSRTAPQRARPNILHGRRSTTTAAPAVSEPSTADPGVEVEGEEPKPDAAEEAVEDKETSTRLPKVEVSAEPQQTATSAPPKLNRLKSRPVLVVSEKPKVTHNEVSLSDRRNRLTSLRKKPVAATEEGTEAPKVNAEDAEELKEGESNPVAVEAPQEVETEPSEAPAPTPGKNAINRLRGNRIPGQLAPRRSRS